MNLLTDYIAAAMAIAEYDKLEDGTYAGQIAKLPGVLAFGPTLRSCQAELQSTLEEWILLGLKLGHRFPRLGAIDLNRRPNARLAAHQAA